ncbi:unnamed protein product, partial [marine sediment metagenome]
FFGIILFANREGHPVAVLEGLSDINSQKIQQEENIRQMVSGYPIEEMLPYLLEKDPTVAAFLVSIAKKESNWGKRSPKYKSQDCYNYWGYRGPNRVGSGGHSCFATPQEAVNVVAKRIENLVSKDIDTPEKMIIWKCGSSCAAHSKWSVTKWISDVNLYFKKLTAI